MYACKKFRYLLSKCMLCLDHVSVVNYSTVLNGLTLCTKRSKHLKMSKIMKSLAPKLLVVGNVLLMNIFRRSFRFLCDMIVQTSM